MALHINNGADTSMLATVTSGLTAGALSYNEIIATAGLCLGAISLIVQVYYARKKK